ncbi:MAG: CHAT domain-containing protein, partial [Chitinophagaceae bacterium]|nr:CHAT domain-containing protein [Chitinophagaceae bacterium]
TNEINHNIGLINLYLGAVPEAIKYFRKVTYNNNRIVRLYNDMGIAYLNLEKYDSAEAYFKKAFEANSKLNKAPNVAHGLTLKYSGDLQVALQKPHTALKFYQHALHQFYPAYNDTNITTNPQSFSGVFSYINLFNTLVAKADALHNMYENSAEINFAKQELITYQSAFKLIDYVQKSYDSDESRLFLNKIKYVIHSKPINIAIELYNKTKEMNYLESAYIFDQKNKASVLSFNQQQNQVLNNVNDPLVDKERELKTSITRLSLKATQLNESSEIEKINAAIRDNEIQLGKLQEQLSKRFTVTDKIPSIKELQKLLDGKTTLLSYHLSQNELITLVVSKKNFTYYQRPLYATFRDDVSSYINSLHDFSKDSDSFQLLAKKISAVLNLNNVPPGTTRLIIIPDDELNFMPFETIRDKNQKYLIESFSIQYQYSTALLQKEKKKFKHHKTIAFAPFATSDFTTADNYTFTRLPYSFNEIKNIKGKAYVGTSALKETFLKNLSDYDVIHLATHAVVNDTINNFSYIAFAPVGKSKEQFLLYAQEIYNLNLRNTNLVILSACETGSGNLVKGEGIMSLSRAFAYSGCPNIITSLWKADDMATAYIANKLHEYLSEGLAVDEAIRRAKLSYLSDNRINPRMKQPAYWAHLIFIGNYLPHQTNNTLKWILLLIVVIMTATFILYHQKKPGRSQA